MRSRIFAQLFASSAIVLASTQSLFAQFGQPTTAGTGAAAGGLQAAANANSLLQSTTSTNGFAGFTTSFGSGNVPFGQGNLSLNGNARNGIGTLAGATTQSGVGATGGIGNAIGGLGGGGLTGGLGGGGLGGLGGIGGGGLGGLGGGGLGGLGGGLGGFGGGLGGLGGGRNSFGGGLGGLGGGGFGGTNRLGGANQGQSKTTLRTTMKPVLVVNPVPATQRTTEIQNRMSRIRLPERYRDVQVTVQGRKAILTGVADSEEDVKFIARLLSLEPGIDSVESQLRAREPASEPVQASPNR
jgi:hypothetical protein